MSHQPWIDQPNGDVKEINKKLQHQQRPRMQTQPLQQKPDDFPLTITCDCGNDLTELRFRWKARKSLVDIGKLEILQVQVLICDDCGNEVILDEKIQDLQNSKPQVIAVDPESS